MTVASFRNAMASAAIKGTNAVELIVNLQLIV